MIKVRYRILIALTALLLGLVSSTALAGGAPVFATPEQKQILRGAHNLKHGYYGDAIKSFQRAAEYGSKHAQKTIGMMYLQGVGVDRDWSMGYAWLKLASTHGDPAAISARDEVLAQLKGSEKSKIDRNYKKLEKIYGDRQALLRREEWVRKQKRQMTGSRTGQNAGVQIQIADETGYTWKVSGSIYFEMLQGSYVEEFRQHMGEVDMGELRLADKAEPDVD